MLIASVVSVECGSAVEEGATHGFQHRPCNQRVHARSGVHLQDKAPDAVSPATNPNHGKRPFIMRDHGLGSLCCTGSWWWCCSCIAFALASTPSKQHAILGMPACCSKRQQQRKFRVASRPQVTIPQCLWFSSSSLPGAFTAQSVAFCAFCFEGCIQACIAGKPFCDDDRSIRMSQNHMAYVNGKTAMTRAFCVACSNDSGGMA